jgi:hypothetical protein
MAIHNSQKGQQGFVKQDPLWRIEQYTDKSGGVDACWPWLGHINDQGYAIISIAKKSYRVSRLVWSIHNGKPFPGDKNACHSCDNPPCVNPTHIFPGTQLENIRDAIAKKRFVFNTAHIRDNPNKYLTHCKHGHEFSTENTYVSSNGYRTCKTCRRRIDLARYYRSRRHK